MTADLKQQTFIKRISYYLNFITVEPLALILLFSDTIIQLANQNMYTEKACRVELKYDKTVCDALMNRNNVSAYTPEQEQAVKEVISQYKTYKMAFLGIVPFFMLAMLGAWSDRSGKKKKLLVVPFVGNIGACICYLLCTIFFMQLGIEYLVASEVGPSSLYGGYQLMFMALCSYVGVISTLETRTTRIGMVSAIIRVSMTLGAAGAGVIHRWIGFTGIYSTCIVLYLVGLLYMALFLKEVPLKERKKEHGCKQVLDFFSPANFKNTLEVVYKKRPNNNRTKLLVLLLASMLNYGTFIGETDQLFFFTQKKFNMDEVTYSIYNTIYIFLSTAGTLFAVVFFSKKLQWDDATLAIISIVSKILGATMHLFATNVFLFYVGAVLELFNGLILVIGRSLASKFCEPSEIAKVNAVIGLVDALAPLCIGVFYPMCFERMDSSIFMLSIGFNIPSFLLFWWLYVQNKKNYDKQTNITNDL